MLTRRTDGPPAGLVGVLRVGPDSLSLVGRLHLINANRGLVLTMMFLEEHS